MKSRVKNEEDFMKINKLVIDSFGKLEDVSIGLDERVTVITGKNEAGKSSIATFIKYMLYGFSSSRSGDLTENSKKKYMPWDKDRCGGEMYFTSKDGKSYRAVRQTSAKNQSGVFDSDGMPTDIIEAGQHFFGVDEASFKKTAFIGESSVSFSDSGELDEAIRNMVYSADEGVDSSKALKKLDALRKYYLGKSGKSGEIAKLSCEIDELEKSLEKWQGGHKELMSAEYNLRELQNKIAFNASHKNRLESEWQNLEALKAKNMLSEAQRLKSEACDSKDAFEQHLVTMQNGTFMPDEAFAAALDELLRGIASDNAALKDGAEDVENAKKNVESVYTDQKQRQLSTRLEENGNTAEQVMTQLSELCSKAKKYLALGVLFTVLLITIPVAVVFFVKRQGIKRKTAQLCKTYGYNSQRELEAALLSVSSFRSVEKSARDILKNAVQKRIQAENDLQKKYSQLSQQANLCGIETDQSNPLLFDSAREYLAKLKVWLDTKDTLKAKCERDRVAYTAYVSSVNLDELESKAQAYDSTVEVRDEAVIKRELAFYTQANEALSVKERELEKTAAVLAGTLPKPAEIQSRIISLTAMRDEMKNKHEALEMAISTLENACDSMKKQAAPLIAAESGHLFSKITHGKYSNLYTNSTMSLSFGDEQTSLPRDAGYLSTGTREAAYISLRIALCKFLYKEEPVLVFDDAFSHLDDTRLKSTLDYLWTLSEEFQIIILSCHNREKEFFDGKCKIIDFEI